MRRISTLAVAAALALAGCGEGDAPETPAACIADADEYLAALERAPGEVRLAGGTPISACLVREQDGGALASVGKAMVDAATELNAEARRNPNGDAGLQLGYLLGAVEAATEETSGIHADLELRLNSAARYAGSREDRLPLGLERRINEGYAAGRAAG